MSRTSKIMAAVIGITGLLGLNQTVNGAEWWVDGNEQENGIGTPEDPFNRIFWGIDAAQNGDEVILKDATYNKDLDKNNSLMGKAILVRSELGPVGCIIDCGQSGRAFICNSGEGNDTVIREITIRNGLVADYGGALACLNSSSPLVVNCTLQNNVSTLQGGAVFSEDSSPQFLGGTITGNESGAGGGLYFDGGHPVLDGCCITLNHASKFGGGFAGRFVTAVTATNCLISNNSADGDGGGAWLDASTMAMTHCALTENSAKRGGAIMFYGPQGFGQDDPQVLNCVISGNTASGELEFPIEVAGGGIYSEGGRPHLTNCKFTGNRAASQTTLARGGGLRLDTDAPIINCLFASNRADGAPFYAAGGGAYFSGNTAAVAANSIFWSNTASGIPSQIEYVGTAPNVTYSDVEGGGWAGEGNIADDPLFLAPGHWEEDPEPVWVPGNYHLPCVSPCVGAGSCAVVGVTEDLEGQTREVGIVDMGPYENQCPDVDGNCVVNPIDSGLVQSKFGCTVCSEADPLCTACDIDGNGVVNPIDSGLVMASFGTCP